MVLFLLVIPLVVVALAAGAAFVSIRNSTLRITAAGVEFRNYPQATQTVPLPQAAPKARTACVRTSRASAR